MGRTTQTIKVKGQTFTMKERTCCFLKLVLEFTFLHLLRDCSQLFWVLVCLVCWDHGSSIVDFFRNVEDDDDDRQSDYLFPALSQMEGEDYEATNPSVDWINNNCKNLEELSLRVCDKGAC